VDVHRKIWVYMDWAEAEKPALMGVLTSERLRGKEVFSFENDKDWLKIKELRALDPDLGLFSGRQYLPTDKSNFGLFLDSSPDRWGRTLMRRRETQLAKMENRAVRTLFEADYLMGVYDGNRMGALRFKNSPDGDFMDNNRTMATPPWASIKELEHASMQLEKEELTNPDYNRWLNLLIAPGSSLGGARPKASILDDKGALWIAKFPSGNDLHDMGAWEAVTAELARRGGIEVAPFRAQSFSCQQHTFLTKRFDRTDSGKRIHFASAMTLLGYTDGANHTEGVSYLNLAEWIMAHCTDTDANLEQLWRRIVFNIGVSNCDDHLRNHGFLLTHKGWTLSPAYDMNPDENGTGLILNISENDNTLDVDLALSVATWFGLSNEKAKSIAAEIKTILSTWRKIADQFRIPKMEQEIMQSAFRL
jgi:serine/threonine-protein kinase HipA